MHAFQMMMIKSGADFEVKIYQTEIQTIFCQEFSSKLYQEGWQTTFPNRLSAILRKFIEKVYFLY